MKQTIRQFLKDITPEGANSIFGHKTKHQVAQWMAHGQIPFKAADKVFEAMFFTELADPEREVDPAVMGEQNVPSDPEYTPEQLRVMDLEAQLHIARQSISTPEQPLLNEQVTGTKLTWADVAKAGANKPVQPSAQEQPKEIASGVLEIDPSEQSTNSMTLPGRVKAAVNLPPRPTGTTMGPSKIDPRTNKPVVRPVPTSPSPVGPHKQTGWVQSPNKTPARVPGWTQPTPKPPKVNGQ